MRSYKLIHAIAHCADCKWEEEGYLVAVKEAEKHHKKTGHEINIEKGYWRKINRTKQNI